MRKRAVEGERLKSDAEASTGGRRPENEAKRMRPGVKPN
jgi:hypothetical protein